MNEQPIIIQQSKEPEKRFTHEQLLSALFFIWDAFDRGPVEFFLIRDTAKQAKEGKDLSGSGVDVGVRALEWVSGGKRVMDNFTGQYLVKENEMGAEYIWADVPVRVHVFSDNECLSSFDTIFYQNETFLLPNPYEKFAEKYENG